MNQLITLPRLLWLSVAICSILSIDGYAANESLTSWTQSDGPHFIYVDGSGHLNQVWYTLDSGVWSAQDLTATVGASSATLATALTSWVQSDGPHFIYVDGNGHLNQIWYTLDSGVWSAQDLTATVGASSATAATALTSWMQSDGPHFIYVDGNGHLNQIWYTLDSGVWSAQDLKATLGGELPPPGGTAPPPPPGPTPTPTPTTSRQYGPSSYATFLLTGLTTDPTTGFVTAGTLASQQAFPFDAGQRIIVLAAAPVTFSKFQFASATLASSQTFPFDNGQRTITFGAAPVTMIGSQFTSGTLAFPQSFPFDGGQATIDFAAAAVTISGTSFTSGTLAHQQSFPFNGGQSLITFAAAPVTTNGSEFTSGTLAFVESLPFSGSHDPIWFAAASVSISGTYITSGTLATSQILPKCDGTSALVPGGSIVHFVSGCYKP